MFRYSVACSVELFCSMTFSSCNLQPRRLKMSSIRPKMDDEPEVWKYLEDPNKTKALEDEDKRKERLGKARTFCGQGRNTFQVTEMDTSCPSPGSIPLPSSDTAHPPLPQEEEIQIDPPPLPPQETRNHTMTTSFFSQQFSRQARYASNSRMFRQVSNQYGNYSNPELYSHWSQQPRAAFHGVASTSNFSSSRQDFTDAEQPESSMKSQSRRLHSSSSRRCDFSVSSEPLYQYRTWETVSKEKHKKGTKVRVLSYNVLAQDLLESNTFLYRDLDPAWLAWKQRWKFIKWEVQHFDPDVVTFQEVQFKRPNYFKSHFLPFFEEIGYRAVFKCRTGEKNDGCAIFYKKKCFKLEEYSKVEYFRQGDPILNRENIGLVARLAERDDKNSCLVVATTHLLFNKKRVDVRLAQAALFLAEVDKLRERNGLYSPVILTGDFNSNSDSPVYELMATGNVKFEGIHAGRRVLPDHLLSKNLGVTNNCQYRTIVNSRTNREVPQNPSTNDTAAHVDGLPGHLYHNLNLVSVYGDLERHDVQNPVVSTNHGDWTIVDYIFFSSPICPEGHVTGQLYLNSRLLLPLASNMDVIGRIPSKLCPSDHFPLLADFALVPDS